MGASECKRTQYGRTILGQSPCAAMHLSCLCQLNKLHRRKKLAHSLHTDWHKEPSDSAVFGSRVIQKPSAGPKNA